MSDRAFRISRDVFIAYGPETESFLQGQLSQDIGAIAVGGTALSWLLQPQGKVVALLRVTRSAEDQFVLDTDGGWGVAAEQRLTRFKLRTKCDIEPLAWRCLALRGETVTPPGTGWDLVVPVEWPGMGGYDVFGDGDGEDLGIGLGTDEEYEALRIAAGVPMMGREIDERTIPQEAGASLVDRTVSFTKGCYTGQELVARVDSRGSNVPRRLCHLRLEGDLVPPQGAALTAGEGKPAGEITSATPGLALGYVRRGVDDGTGLDVTWDGGRTSAVVEPLVPAG